MDVITGSANLGHVDPITLPELLALPDLQTRRDRKYLITTDELADLATDLPRAVRALDRDGTRHVHYESTYFDTADRVSYLGGAHRRPHRFKVRTRCYLDSGDTMLEVKVRDGRGRTVKHRRPYEPMHRGSLTEGAREYLAAIPSTATAAATLRPALVTSYRRATLVLGDGAARVTIDTDLDWRTPAGAVVALRGTALVETKSPGPPCDLDRVLWRRGIRPTTISKYCTGLAALDPSLPANKWHRVLVRHLGRRGAPTA